MTRDFVLGFLALFTFVGAMYALMPALPIYLEELGSDVKEIGILIGVYNLSALLFRIAVGAALRRFSAKSIMAAGALLFAITFVACLTIRPFWPFLILRFLQGSSFSLMDTAAFAFAVSIIPVSSRGQGLATFMIAITLALALAPALGMYIINRYSFTVLFLTCAGLSLLAFFFSCRLPGPFMLNSIEQCEIKEPILEHRIIAPAMSSFLFNFVWGAALAFVPLYAIRTGINNPGYFFTSIAGMILIGRAIGSGILDRYSKERIIITFILVSMAAMLLIAISTNLWMLILAGLFWGTGCAFFFPAIMAYAFDFAGSSGGPAVGTYRAVADFGTALGPAVMGVVASFTGYRIIFVCLAFMCLVDAVYFSILMKRKCDCLKIPGSR
ncbi:MAG TPA: MFS transporter [Syntrophorhabdaceae bacterium]|nr:MFS transporter [Syntrophorhabdaceae bacterium]